MGTESNRDNRIIIGEEYNLLTQRIIETCKHADYDFTVNSKILTGNINLIFNTAYTQEEVDFVLGGIYETQFYYEKVNYNDLR
jgi:hypothetical protein